MSVIDECEPQTLRAFQKAGWQVVEKPHLIRITDGSLRADAKLALSSEQGLQQIIIAEIKCFTQPLRDLVELYRAIGQYQMYRAALQLLGETSPVYLTIPLMAYQRFQAKPEYLLALENTGVNHVIIDLEQEQIIAWKT
jgi:hypothetical protein